MTDMLAAAKAKLQEKRTEVEGIASGFKVDDKGNFELSTKQYQDYTAAVNAAKEAKAFIDAVEAKSAIDQYLDAPAELSEAGLDAAARGAGGSEVKSLADVFMSSPEFKSAQESGNFKNVGRISGEYEGKSLHSLSGGEFSQPSFGQAQDLGLVEKARRKTRIRDLFPKSTTRANLLHSVVETGWVNNAQQVRELTGSDGSYDAEGNYTPSGAALTGTDLDSAIDPFGTDKYGLKPKSKLLFKPVTYPIATIAHTLDAHRNLLADEPRLRTFINQRMAEGVKFAEDYELLHSVGGVGSEELTGLFNVEGVQDYPGSAEDKFSVQVRRAITMAQLAEYDPTGVVLHPSMWEHVEVEEDGYGGFRVAVNVAVGAVKQLWHLDVVATTAMPQTHFLVGAFGLGAMLHDREAVSVTMSTENRDNYERNVVTFRAEERLALEVPRPEAFVLGTWTDYAPAGG